MRCAVAADIRQSDAWAAPQAAAFVGLPRREETTAPAWRSRLLSLSIVVATSVLVFWPTLRNGFLPLGFDDGIILDTEALRALGTQHLWTLATTFNHAHYVPLTMLSLALDYQVWGLDPFGYHLTNVLLHALTAALVCTFLWPLVSARVATLGALLFAVHPVQMEAVSVAVQRKTVLAGALFFLTLILYQHWCTQRRPRWYVACLLAFMAAGLAKPAVVTLPLVLVLYDTAFGDGRVDARRRWAEKVPFMAIAVAVSVAAVRAHVAVAALHPLHGGTLLAHMLLVSRVVCEYVDAVLFPVGLSPIYYYPRAIVYAPANVLALALLPSVVVAVTLRRRRYPWSCFCLWWFLLVLLPESNLVPLAQLRADRFLYLSMMAAGLWIAIGIERLDRLELLSSVQRAGTRWIGPALVGICAVLCYASAGVWRDDVSAWSRVVDRHPWCAVAHGFLGQAYYDQGDAARAELALSAAVRLSDAVPDAHRYLAKVYAERGRYDTAERELRQLLTLLPDDADGLQLLADLQRSNGS